MHHDLYFLIIEKTMKTSHQPQKVSNRSRFYIIFSKKLLSYKRCSRSLCSSQTTTPPHTPPPEHQSTQHQPEDQITHTSTASRFSYVQETRNKPTQKSVVASGPNSVPNTTHHHETTLDETFPASPKGCCTYFRSPRANRHLFH